MDSRKIIEIIPDRLYWHSAIQFPQKSPDTFVFSIDTKLVYCPYWKDFGPLNLGMVHRYCNRLKEILADPQHAGKKIIHHCSSNVAKRANAAFCICAYLVVIKGETAEQAWSRFARKEQFVPFRDACRAPCTYKCTIQHCLKGLQRALNEDWYSFDTFDLGKYEFYEKLENGDMNWILPGKLLAFSSPSSIGRDPYGNRIFTPDDYVPVFKSLGVTTVVRLNNKLYNAARFKKAGIKHHELFFPDGSCPSEKIVQSFLRIVEQEPGALAIHCLAGLGRTGTLIGCYLMKHHGITAQEFIGWSRIARPGSVLGPQAQFLVGMQAKCKDWGNSIQMPIGQMSPLDKQIANDGDHGQAETLIAAKRANQSPNIFNTPPPPARAASLEHYSRSVNSSVKSKVGKIAPRRNIFAPQLEGKSLFSTEDNTKTPTKLSNDGSGNMPVKVATVSSLSKDAYP